MKNVNIFDIEIVIKNINNKDSNKETNNSNEKEEEGIEDEEYLLMFHTDTRIENGVTIIIIIMNKILLMNN
jgi:hypothetical protein